MQTIEIKENGIYLVWEIDEENNLKLLHFSALPFHREDIVAATTEYGFRFVEMNLSGFISGGVFLEQKREYQRHASYPGELRKQSASE